VQAGPGFVVFGRSVGGSPGACGGTRNRSTAHQCGFASSIDTPILALKGAERETLYKNITAKNLIPRAGKAEEVAQAIVFLVQNDFVTGTTIDVDGGWLLS
jgi:NAD(P)-dependent dehydrogenase (short-subunit alcohol dehydrogenase family)